MRAVPDLPRLIDLMKRLMEANRWTGNQITTGDTRRGRRHWVYGRAGRPCWRCGTAIRVRREPRQADGLSELKPSKPNAQTEWREREESKRAIFESRDADFRDAACHRNVILADDTLKAAVRGNPGNYRNSGRQERGSQNAPPEQRLRP